MVSVYFLSPLPAFATTAAMAIFLPVLNSNFLKDDPIVPLSFSSPFDYHLAIPTYRAVANIQIGLKHCASAWWRLVFGVVAWSAFLTTALFSRMVFTDH